MRRLLNGLKNPNFISPISNTTITYFYLFVMQKTPDLLSNVSPHYYFLFNIMSKKESCFKKGTIYFMSIKSLAEEINYQNLDELNTEGIIRDLQTLFDSNKSPVYYSTPYWEYIMNVQDLERLENIYGKFMMFRGNINSGLIEKFHKLIESGIIPILKYATDKKSSRSKVICFYTTANKEEMKNLCEFLVNEGLTNKDLSYKLEQQTKSNLYGEEFSAAIHLSDFVKLQ